MSTNPRKSPTVPAHPSTPHGWRHLNRPERVLLVALFTIAAVPYLIGIAYLVHVATR